MEDIRELVCLCTVVCGGFFFASARVFLKFPNFVNCFFFISVTLNLKCAISKVMFSLFNQSFQHDSFPILAAFLCFLGHFPLLVLSKHKTGVALGTEMHWIASTLCKVCIPFVACSRVARFLRRSYVYSVRKSKRKTPLMLTIAAGVSL